MKLSLTKLSKKKLECRCSKLTLKKNWARLGKWKMQVKHIGKQ